jgi:hypothetical protein
MGKGNANGMVCAGLYEKALVSFLSQPFGVPLQLDFILHVFFNHAKHQQITGSRAGVLGKNAAACALRDHGSAVL